MIPIRSAFFGCEIISMSSIETGHMKRSSRVNTNNPRIILVQTKRRVKNKYQQLPAQLVSQIKQRLLGPRFAEIWMLQFFVMPVIKK